MACFIMVCLSGKIIVITASQMFLLQSQLTFITKFHNIEYFKNFLSFSSIIIHGAQLKEAGY